MSLGAAVLVGAAAGLLAGTCAFVIAYGEYKHHFWEKGKPRRMAWQTATATFVVFFVLIVLASRMLQR